MKNALLGKSLGRIGIGESLPIFVAMADADNEDIAVVIDSIDHQMRFNGMDANCRCNCHALSGGPRIVGKKPETLLQPIMVSLGLV